jgi:hypothetical protein
MKTLFLSITAIMLVALMSCGGESNNSGDLNNFAQRWQQRIQLQKQQIEQEESSISIQKIVTGMEQRYSDDILWYPCVAIKFKNNSNEDITDGIKITAVFIDNDKGEQIGSDLEFIAGVTSNRFIAGTTAKVTIKCSTGWGIGSYRNVTTRIYIGDALNDDKLIDTVKISNTIFMEME